MPARKIPLATRFWSKVDKSNSSGCWPWLGVRRPDGMRYGIIKIDMKTRYAHRIAFYLHNGRHPENGKVVLHTCDNPICVNPAHLKEGTPADNVDDCISKGRNAVGSKNGMTRPEVRAKIAREKNPMAKLTQEEVALIRRLHDNGEQGSRLAERFKVSCALISLITNWKRWPH